MAAMVVDKKRNERIQKVVFERFKNDLVNLDLSGNYAEAHFLAKNVQIINKENGKTEITMEIQGNGQFYVENPTFIEIETINNE